MTVKRNQEELFRLATILYADNNYDVKSETIYKKIIESIFLENENIDLDIDGIIDLIQVKYSLHFTNEEVLRTINKNKNSFIRNNKTYCLEPKRLNTLKKKVNNKSITDFILEFSEKNSRDFEKSRKVIHEFLYHLFTVNANSFERLIENKTLDIKNISVQKITLSDEEREIINDFLNWDNYEKNKAIFDIASYSLEFCILTNNKNSKDYKLRFLNNKVFYLDTNVLFRAVGLNGETRKKRTRLFLNKFIEAGEKLQITSLVKDEFNTSLDFHVANLQSTYNANIKSEIFLEVRKSQDFSNFYHNWRKTRTNPNLELFKSYVKGELRTLMNSFKIELDEEFPYDINDPDTIEQIKDYTSSIKTFKGDDVGYRSVSSDAESILWIEKKRKKLKSTIFESKYFLISTDNKLRIWDYNKDDNTPTVLLPNQWMSILLRYLKRSDDDFKSFVSFLNLPNREVVIPADKLNVILTGIAEITADLKQQQSIVHSLIETKAINILDPKIPNDELIYDVKIFAETELEKQNTSLTEKIKSLNEDIKTKDNQIEKIKDTARNKKGINQSLEVENTRLINTIVAKDFSKWKLKWNIIYPLAILIEVLILLDFFFFENIEFLQKIISTIDSYNSTKQTVSIAIITGAWGIPFVFFFRSLIKTNKKSTKEAKKQQLKEKYINNSI